MKRIWGDKINHNNDLFMLCTVFQTIITILVYGILFYPLFACMTTDHRLVGSLVGFLYVTIW